MTMAGYLRIAAPVTNRIRSDLNQVAGRQASAGAAS